MGRFAFGIVATLIIINGIFSQFINERTLENCEVHWNSNVISAISPNTVVTSCGWVYVANHSKSGFFNIGAIADKNEVIWSNKTIDIKATGWPLAYAYEVTPSK